MGRRKRKRVHSEEDEYSDQSEWDSKRSRPESRKFHYITTEAQSEELGEEIKKETIIGVDLKGVKLGRRGQITYLAIAWPGSIACMDIEQLSGIPSWTKDILENIKVTKVMHDCRGDTENLYYQYDIKLCGVFDTTVANLVNKKIDGKKYNRFDNLVEIVRMETRPRNQLPSYMFGKERVDVMRYKSRMKPIWESRGRETVWGRTPLSKFEQKYSTLNCLLTIVLYNHYIKKFRCHNKKSLILQRVEDISAYFASAYLRRVERTHHIPKSIKKMIKKPWRFQNNKRKKIVVKPQELVSSSDEPIIMPQKRKKSELNAALLYEKTKDKLKDMTHEIFPSLQDKDIGLD